MSQSQQDRLEAARIDAVKSATEIINGISRSLTFKDIDLLLINTFILPRQDNIYQVCDDWANRDYRQVGLVYGGTLAVVSLLLMAMNSFALLPIVLFVAVFARYVMLRRALTTLSRRRSMHQFTMDIARYVILRNKIEGKKTTFRDISTKYTTLKYARDRSSISGCDFIRLFVSLDMEIDFYNMLHGVIDDVLEYVIDGEDHASLPSEAISPRHEDEPNDHWEHDSDPQEFLSKPPEASNSSAALTAENDFTSVLVDSGDREHNDDEEDDASASTEADTDTSPSEAPEHETSREEEQDRHDSSEPSSADEAKEETDDDETDEVEQLQTDTTKEKTREADSDDEDHEPKDSENDDQGDAEDFPLDDFDKDLESMDIPTPSPASDDDEEEEEDDSGVDDDLLKDFGLSDDDFK